MKNFKINAVIFDLDGTLVDSKLNFDLMRKEIGIPNDYPILEYVEESNDQKFKDFAFEVIHKHELQGAKMANPLRDADEFINLLSQNNIPKAIVTRNSKPVTDLTLSKFDWNFDIVLTRDCAPAKPSPEAIFMIVNELNLNLQNTLYIGDHGFDLETAKNAKCIAGLITHDYNKKLSLNADIVINDFCELNHFMEIFS